jgi:peroxiredoxin
MGIKVGDRLPGGTLTEMIDTEQPGCTIGPNTFNVADLTKGKKVVIFGLPGAFTRPPARPSTCPATSPTSTT